MHARLSGLRLQRPEQSTGTGVKMDLSPRLGLPYIAPQQAQKQVTYNEAIRALDVLVQPVVMSRTTATPPGSPAAGDTYIVAPSATGAWAGKDGKIATFVDGGWDFVTPANGWLAYVNDTAQIAVSQSGAWSPLVTTGGTSIAKFGINATADRHQPIGRGRRCKPLQPRRHEPSAEGQQERGCRYREPAVPDQLHRPRRVRAHRRRRFSAQGFRQRQPVVRRAGGRTHVGRGQSSGRTARLSGRTERLEQSQYARRLRGGQLDAADRRHDDSGRGCLRHPDGLLHQDRQQGDGDRQPGASRRIQGPAAW